MTKEMPATVKRSIEITGLLVLGTIVVVGKTIIMPLILAFFISLVLIPLFRFFRKLKLPEYIAVFLPVLLFIVVVGLVIMLFYSQVDALVDNFPQIENTVTKHLNNLSIWVSNTFGYTPAQQLKFIDVQSKKLFSSMGSVLGGAVGSLSETLIFIGLLPIYIYLIMLYRNLFIKFVLMWFKKDEHKNVEEGLRQIEKMVKHYLLGLMIQITYIIILLGGALWIFGVQNALLIGIIFAVLNLVPYLGALIGIVLGITLTLASSDRITDVLIVLAAIAVVQFLDNNILMPRIVGSQVRINPLVSIVGIFVGGMLAGLPGMFLAMPAIAILKIVFDRTENYKQWGVLLGDERPQKSQMVD